MKFALLIRNKVLESSIDYLNPGTFYNHPVMLGVRWLRMCGIDIDRSDKYPSTILTVEGIKPSPTTSTSVLRAFGERCGAYAECWKELGKPEGWLGCSLPKGHEGDHRDEGERIE